MKLQIDSKDQIVEKKTDGRGRLTLGSEYAGKTVQVAILDGDVEGETDEEAE